MKTNEYHRKAIDLIATDLPWKDIVIAIAKHRPSVFVKAAGLVLNGDWRSQAAKLFVIEGKKIDAIKLCRSATGASLVEAKEIVESLTARDLVF